jgi:hypothetical protein
MGEYEQGTLRRARDALTALVEERGDMLLDAMAMATRDRIEEVLGDDRPDERPRERTSWKEVDRHTRERLVVELLGDDRLTVKELTGRFTAELPECRDLWEPNVRRLVERMARGGQLCRRQERWRPGASGLRWRYYRNAKLSGPIAALERTINGS